VDGKKGEQTDIKKDITKLTVAFGRYANAPKKTTG
jgi:hypothetical protein